MVNRKTATIKPKNPLSSFVFERSEVGSDLVFITPRNSKRGYRYMFHPKHEVIIFITDKAGNEGISIKQRTSYTRSSIIWLN